MGNRKCLLIGLLVVALSSAPPLPSEAISGGAMPAETPEICPDNCFAQGTIRGSSPRIRVQGRCFVTVEGDPFFPIADTAWLLVRLSHEDIAHYIAARSSQGFNVIKFGPESANIDFERLGFILDTLEAHGMYAELFVPGYDYPNNALLEDIPGIAEEIAKRFLDRNNLFAYAIEGMDSPHGKRNPADMRARLIEAWKVIKSVDPERLVSFHPLSGRSLVDHSGISPDYLDFYAVHQCNAGSIADLLQAEFVRRPEKPVYLTEPVYEGRGNMCGCRNGCTGDQALTQIMSAIRAGAAGISYGHYAVWSFNLGKDGSWGVDPSPEGIPWKDALYAPGTQGIAELLQGMPGSAPELE